MKLIFLGTRGFIRERSERHRMHAALLAEYYGRRLMIDCGEDWRGRLADIRPRAILITHAHPDHAWGLREGAPCPVYASRESWEAGLQRYPLRSFIMVEPRRPLEVENMIVEYFPVDHSSRAPAGGYRLTAGRVSVFYAPDVIYIHDRRDALEGCRLYIGDGATITRSMVRKPGETLIGHTPVRTQLGWCRDEGVPEAVFTHCGSDIVKNGDAQAMARIAPLAEERGVEAAIAHDGMARIIR
jgi:phosphoribosyl 1,2-cyclic phosphodiesterase